MRKLTYKHTKIACYLSYTVSAIVNNFTPLLFILFVREFSVGMAQLTALITVNFGIQMTVDFLGAAYVDKLGYRKTMIIASCFAAGGLIGLGTLPYILSPFAGIFVSVILYAIGGGMTEVLVSPIVEALPEDGKAASMSFLHSFYSWGQMAVVLGTTLYFVFVGEAMWRYLCYIWAILPVCAAIMFTAVPLCTLTEEDTPSGVGRVLKMPIFWIFAMLMLCAGASELAMSQWASLFCETALGISKTTGDLLGPCMFALAMGISRVLYGKIGTKLSLVRYIVLSSVMCAISYLAVGLSQNSVVSLLGCALCGFSVGVMWPGTLSLASKTCPDGGTAMFGLLAFAGDVGCTVGPFFAATMAEVVSVGQNNLQGGLFCCVLFPLLIVLFAIGLKKKKRADL